MIFYPMENKFKKIIVSFYYYEIKGTERLLKSHVKFSNLVIIKKNLVTYYISLGPFSTQSKSLGSNLK